MALGECEWQESQTCLTSVAVIPTSLEDDALFLRRNFAAPSRNFPPQELGSFFPFTDALAFVPLLSSMFDISTQWRNYRVLQKWENHAARQCSLPSSGELIVFEVLCSDRKLALKS